MPPKNTNGDAPGPGVSGGAESASKVRHPRDSLSENRLKALISDGSLRTIGRASSQRGRKPSTSLTSNQLVGGANQMAQYIEGSQVRLFRRAIHERYLRLGLLNHPLSFS